MDIEGYGLAEGCNADLTLLAGRDAGPCGRRRRTAPAVVKGGRVVARDGQAVVDMP